MSEQWKLVPVEPTPEMIDAAYSHDDPGVNWYAAPETYWAAMLAAAPAAPAQEPVAFTDDDVFLGMLSINRSWNAYGQSREAAVQLALQVVRKLLAAPAPAVAAQGDELPPLPQRFHDDLEAMLREAVLTKNTLVSGWRQEMCTHMRAYARAALAGRRN